ncbi:MAG: hypothetical protein GF399_03330 [Candidatus Coatesbacteria bacterium]|nr:hypothetical protein [Candidatus Coatesbacteria bacterium]
MGKVAWGLDLAGLSSTKQGLARAENVDEKTINVTIYDKHIFKRRLQVWMETLKLLIIELLIA